VSIYEIGVSYWALVGIGLVATALIAAFADSVSRTIRQSLGNQMERLRNEYERASAAFHEPLPSSPSHPSFPPPR
jgi:hypothetical protein